MQHRPPNERPKLYSEEFGRRGIGIEQSPLRVDGHDAGPNRAQNVGRFELDLHQLRGEGLATHTRLPET